MAAFRDCIARKVRAIECDVRLSKDNKAMVIHDPKINRVTTSKGHVCHMMSTDLKQYDIPFFNDLLEILKPHPNIHLFVEVKDVGKKNDILVQEVVTSIKNMNMISTCSVISFRPSILKGIKALCPRIRTGYIYGPLWIKNPFPRVRACGADMLWLHHSLVTNSLITKHGGVPIYAWTANDELTIKRLQSAGVSGIITDIPEFLSS